MKNTKTIAVIALLVGGAIAVYFLLKYSSAPADGENKNPVDKTLRFLGMKDDLPKDSRFDAGGTGKAKPFYNMPVKPDKDSRFDTGTTGKSVRFS